MIQINDRFACQTVYENMKEVSLTVKTEEKVYIFSFSSDFESTKIEQKRVCRTVWLKCSAISIRKFFQRLFVVYFTVLIP